MIDETKRKNPISSPIGLQIDNLVYNQHGEMVTIRPNDFHRFMQPRMNGDYGIYGIPITSELLEQCGFEAYHEERSIKIGRRYFLCAEPISDGMQVFTENTNLDDECKMYHSHIKYLHQIQNLYFALTGTELTYNPNQP